MKDVHIHILPGIDDGAEDIDESLWMAEAAVNSGITTIVATPHCNLPGKYDNKWNNDLKNVFQNFREEIKAENLQLEVLDGMEIFASNDIVEKLKEGRLITLNHTRYPLVEFDFSTSISHITVTLMHLIDAGYQPILAHPERYYEVQSNISVLYEWYEMGVVIQINKDSILGAFGQKVQYAADKILQHRLATVIASDAHGIQRRTPDLTELKRFCFFHYGEGALPLLMGENAYRIIHNLDVIWADPIPFQK